MGIPYCRSYVDQVFLAASTLVESIYTKIELAVNKITCIFFGSDYTNVHFALIIITGSLLAAYVIEKSFPRLWTTVINRDSLKSRITAENRKHYKRSIKATFEDVGIWLDTPSKALYISFVVSFVVLFGASHSCSLFPAWLVWDGESNLVQTLITILTGIGAVLFALIIFIAQLGRDGVGRYAVRVYLLRTKLLMLVTLCLSGTVLTLGSHLNVIIIGILLSLFLLTVRAVFWIIRLTLSHSQMEMAVDKLMRRELVLHVEKSVNRRIGQNILRQFLKEKGELVEFLPWVIERDKYEHITLSETGLVRDVNLRLLDEALKLIQKATAIEAASSSAASEIEATKGEYKDKRTYGFIQKSIGDEIEGESRSVFSIKKGLIKDQLLFHLKDLVWNAFSVTPSYKHSSDDLKNQLREIQQKFIVALKDSPCSNVYMHVRTYGNLAEEFLKVLKRYPGRYDLRSASSEIANEFWGESWEEIGWLYDDVKSIISYALRNAESIETEVLLAVLYLPISICYRAIQNADNFLFQKFLPLLLKHCQYGGKINDLELRNLVLDRCVQYPRELTDYYILPKLKKHDFSHNDRERLGDSLIFLISIYCGLTRIAFLDANVDLLNKFIFAIDSCAENFRPGKDRWNTKHLRWRLEATTSEIEKTKLCEDLQEQEFLEKLATTIEEQKQGSLYGIACRLLDAVVEDDRSRWLGSLTKVLNLLPTNFIDLFKVSRIANSLDSSGFCSFDRWDREPLEGVYWCRLDSNLAEVLCIRLLMNSQSLELEVDSTQITNDMGFQCQTDGTIHRALENVLAKKTRLLGILTEEQFNSINKLRDLLASIVAAQKKNEQNTKQSSPLSENRLQEFTSTAVKEFHEHITLRLILHNHFRCYENKLDSYETKDVITIGINKIDDKAIFLDPWHVSYNGWARVYGEGVASGEDSFLVHKLKSYLPTEERGNLEKCLQVIDDGIIVLVNLNSYLFFKEFSWEFTPEYLIKDKSLMRGFSGQLNVRNLILPVYSIFAPNEESGVLLLNSQFKLRIEQLAPFDPEKKTYTIHQELGIEITDLNTDETRRKEFIERAPPWLTEESTDKQEQDDYLRGRVQVMVIEKMRVTFVEQASEVVRGFWVPAQDGNINEV